MYVTAQGPRLRNDLYCVEWDVELYYTLPFQTRRLRGGHDRCSQFQQNSSPTTQWVDGG